MGCGYNGSSTSVDAVRCYVVFSNSEKKTVLYCVFGSVVMPLLIDLIRVEKLSLETLDVVVVNPEYHMQ